MVSFWLHRCFYTTSRYSTQAGIDSSNWNWKAVRRNVQHGFALALSRSSCLNHPHRLGFVLKRCKKRLRKGGPSAAVSPGGGVYRADGSGATDVSQDILRRRGRFASSWQLAGQLVLKEEPALVDSTRPAIGRLQMGSRCNGHANDRPLLRPPEHWPQGLVAGSSQEMTHSQTIRRTLPRDYFLRKYNIGPIGIVSWVSNNGYTTAAGGRQGV